MTTNYNLSNHSSKRMKQRGITQTQLALLVSLGDCENAKDGACKVTLSNKSINFLLKSKELADETKKLLRQNRDKLVRRVAIIHDAIIVTSYCRGV